MEQINAFLQTPMFLYMIIGGMVILFILYILNCIKLHKIKREYNIFMKKLGNGKNIEDMLKNYIFKMEDIEAKNQELQVYCNKIDNDIKKCIQKVGIVRYSAFKDMGSDLSFALALLNEENNGVVLNGIYSSEISNIYAKPVEKGTSNYKISDEERQAINIAMRAEETHRIRE